MAAPVAKRRRFDPPAGARAGVNVVVDGDTLRLVHVTAQTTLRDLAHDAAHGPATRNGATAHLLELVPDSEARFFFFVTRSVDLIIPQVHKCVAQFGVPTRWCGWQFVRNDVTYYFCLSNYACTSAVQKAIWLTVLGPQRAERQQAGALQFFSDSVVDVGVTAAPLTSNAFVPIPTGWNNFSEARCGVATGTRPCTEELATVSRAAVTMLAAEHYRCRVEDDRMLREQRVACNWDYAAPELSSLAQLDPQHARNLWNVNVDTIVGRHPPDAFIAYLDTYLCVVRNTTVYQRSFDQQANSWVVEVFPSTALRSLLSSISVTWPAGQDSRGRNLAAKAANVADVWMGNTRNRATCGLLRPLRVNETLQPTTMVLAPPAPCSGEYLVPRLWAPHWVGSTHADTVNCGVFLRLMWEVWACERTDMFLQLVSFFATMVQNPMYEKTIGLAVYGSQGCGKGTLLTFMKEVLGPLYKVVDMKQAGSSFNASYADAWLVFFDEFTASDVKGRFDSFVKKAITETDGVCVNKKYAQEVYMDVVTWVIMAGNEPYPASERRLQLVNCSNAHVGDADYWQRLNAHDMGELSKHVALWLNLVDVEALHRQGYNLRTRVTPEALWMNIAATLNPVQQWVKQILEDGSLSAQVDAESGHGRGLAWSDLLRQYKAFQRDTGSRSHFDAGMFKREVRECFAGPTTLSCTEDFVQLAPDLDALRMAFAESLHIFPSQAECAQLWEAHTPYEPAGAPVPYHLVPMRVPVAPDVEFNTTVYQDSRVPLPGAGMEGRFLRGQRVRRLSR